MFAVAQRLADADEVREKSERSLPAKIRDNGSDHIRAAGQPSLMPLGAKESLAFSGKVKALAG